MSERQLQVGDSIHALDAEGYLLDREAWNEAIAAALAAEDDVTLDEARWEMIHFLRQHYARFKHLPTVRLLAKAAARELGPEKGDIAYLYELFPRGPGRQLFRYAGLPRPSGCK